MSLRDARSLHEGGHIVGEKLRGIGALGFVAGTRPTKVERDTGELLRVLRHLKRVTGVIGSEVGNENERLSRSLLVVVDGDAVGANSGHESLSFQYSSHDPTRGDIISHPASSPRLLLRDA